MPVKKQELTSDAPLPNLEIGKRAIRLNIIDPHKNPSLSEDLTVVLLRGNGSPRTFRFSLPALQRSLTAVGFAFVLALAATFFLLLWNFFHFTPDRIEAPAVSVPVPAAAPEKGTGFWSKISSPSANVEPGKEDEELRKEVLGLREDVAKLNALADYRKKLQDGENEGLLQFFGPRNVLETAAPMQVKNVKVLKAGNKDTYVDFELHNVDPEQRQARGYIVVLAKTPSFLMSYPPNAFSPTQNIVLDFTKGETFAVSRFRQARAVFAAGPLEGQQVSYQVLLFANDGKVIADLHVENAQ